MLSFELIMGEPNKNRQETWVERLSREISDLRAIKKNNPKRFWFLVIIGTIVGICYTYSFVYRSSEKANKNVLNAQAPSNRSELERSTSGIANINLLVDSYLRPVTYEDNSNLTIKLQVDNTNSLQLIIESHFSYKKPDKLRLNSTVTLKINGFTIAATQYQLFANSGTVFIYDLDKRQYMTITNTTLDLLQRNPENEPLKQLGLATLKPYQFMLNTDKAKLLSRTFNAKVSHVSNQRGEVTTVLSWQDAVRSADKWPGSPNEPPKYKIPVELNADEKGLIFKSTAELTDFFRFLTSNTNFLHNIGPFAAMAKNLISVDAEVNYRDISINGAIPDEYFQFRREEGSQQVNKLPNPLPTKIQELIKPLLH